MKSNLKILLTEEQIQKRVKDLAAQITLDYSSVDNSIRRPVFICTLKGAIYFFADITRNITDIMTADFLSRLIASKSLKSSETSDNTVDMLDPLLRPSRIMPNTLSSSFDFKRLLIALHASSKCAEQSLKFVWVAISMMHGEL